MNFKVLILLLIGVFALQIYVGKRNAEIVPTVGILSEVPSETSLMVSSLGDKQYYFRALAIDLQSAGDSFGRFTALQDYDYKVLRDWFLALDNLDYRSGILPALASYYYSNTQRVSDNQYIVEYLEKNFDKDPNEKWWWLVQAVGIAAYKMDDKVLAARLANKLQVVTAQMPNWARELPALLYADLGEKELALKIIEDLANKYDNYSQGEINYMNYFIRKRLEMKDKEINIQPKVKDVAPVK